MYIHIYMCVCIYTYIYIYNHTYTDSLVAHLVKNLTSVQKTRVQSLGQEDPLEKEMATHSSILAWKILWTEEPVGYSPWVHKNQTLLSD